MDNSKEILKNHERLGAIDTEQDQNNSAQNGYENDLGAIPVDESQPMERSDNNENQMFAQNLRQNNPILYKTSKYISQSPHLRKAINFLDIAAKPISEMGESLRLPEIGAGILQGGYNSAKSIYDIGAKPLSKVSGINFVPPNINLQQKVRQDPRSRLAFSLGEIGGNTAGFIPTFEATGNLPFLKGSSIPAYATRGAIAGGSVDEENRGIGALIGGATGNLGKIDTRNISKITNRQISNNILNKRELKLSEYNKKYEDYFDQLQKIGIEKVKVPILNLEGLSNIPNSKKVLQTIEEFQNNPTPRNAQKAQSDLGKIINKIRSSKSYIEHDITNPVTKAIEEASNAQKRIKGSVVTELLNKKNPDLIKDYMDISEGYKKEVTPYFNKYISQYMKGNINHEELVKSLQGKGQLPLKKIHPEIERKKTIDKLSKALLLAGGGALSYQLAKELGKNKGYNNVIDQY